MVVAPSLAALGSGSRSTYSIAAERRVAIGLHVTLTAPFRRSATASSRCATARSSRWQTLLHARMPAQARPEGARRPRWRARCAPSSRPSAARPTSSTVTSTCTCFRRCATPCSRSRRRDAPDAWVRQCGRAGALASQLGDRKGLLLDVLSRGFRRRAAALGVRTNPAFAGTYDFQRRRPISPRCFRAFSSRLPDGSVVMCHPGLRRRRIAAARSADHAARAGIRLLRRRGLPAVLARHGVALAP